jgi:hypothetical protein
MYRKIEPYKYDLYYKATVYSFQDFIELNERREITSQDGTISEVIVGGYSTNILIANWDMWQIDEDAEVLYLYQLKDIPEKVEIAWVGKK